MCIQLMAWLTAHGMAYKSPGASVPFSTIQLNIIVLSTKATFLQEAGIATSPHGPRPSQTQAVPVSASALHGMDNMAVDSQPMLALYFDKHQACDEEDLKGGHLRVPLSY